VKVAFVHVDPVRDENKVGEIINVSSYTTVEAIKLGGYKNPVLEKLGFYSSNQYLDNEIAALESRLAQLKAQRDAMFP
jgi:hypothetical protein